MRKDNCVRPQGKTASEATHQVPTYLQMPGNCSLVSFDSGDVQDERKVSTQFP